MPQKQIVFICMNATLLLFCNSLAIYMQFIINCSVQTYPHYYYSQSHAKHGATGDQANRTTGQKVKTDELVSQISRYFTVLQTVIKKSKLFKNLLKAHTILSYPKTPL
jgi:hypothetical protein